MSLKLLEAARYKLSGVLSGGRLHHQTRSQRRHLLHNQQRKRQGHPAFSWWVRPNLENSSFVTESSRSGHLEEQEIRTLGRGDYFGEQALLKEDCRTASIIATHPGVECLTLDRDSFKQLIGDLSEIKEKDYGDEQRLARPVGTVGYGVELQGIRLPVILLRLRLLHSWSYSFSGTLTKTVGCRRVSWKQHGACLKFNSKG